MMVPRKNNPPAIRANMTPMIDVVFLLLIFFICTASFQIVEENLPGQVQLEVPAGTNQKETETEAADIEPVILKIGWQQNQPIWDIGGLRCVDFQSLQEKLAAVAAVDSDVPVILVIEPEVPLGYAIDAYDLSRKTGFSEVQFAADASIIKR